MKFGNDFNEFVQSKTQQWINAFCILAKEYSFFLMSHALLMFVCIYDCVMAIQQLYKYIDEVNIIKVQTINTIIVGDIKFFASLLY